MKDITQMDLMVLRELRVVVNNPKLSVLDIINWCYKPDFPIVYDGEVVVWLPKCKALCSLKKSDLG